MTWDDVLRRISAGEPAEDVLDEHRAAQRAEFRRYLMARGQSAATALAEHDRRMRDLDLGLTGARNAWHSISPAQRRVLVAAASVRSGRIVRQSIRPSVYVRDGGGPKLCGVKTVRPLCSRDLMAWDGGAFDPEQAAVLTERGRFVLAHGRSEDSQR